MPSYKTKLTKVGQVFCSLKKTFLTVTCGTSGEDLGIRNEGSLAKSALPKPGGWVKNPAILMQTSSGEKVETLILKASCEALLQPGL